MNCVEAFSQPHYYNRFDQKISSISEDDAKMIVHLPWLFLLCAATNVQGDIEPFASRSQAERERQQENYVRFGGTIVLVSLLLAIQRQKSFAELVTATHTKDWRYDNLSRLGRARRSAARRE